jgi:hypothetical protein
MSPKKKIRFRCDGPVQSNTTFVEDSPEGYGAWYLAQGEIEPRRGVALGLRILFAPLGAAMRSQSIEQVDALILSSERCFTDLMRQAREQAQCSNRSSPEPLRPSSSNAPEATDEPSKPIDESPPHSSLVNPGENLSNLFN